MLKRRILNFIERMKLHKAFAPFYSGLGSILMFHRVVHNDNKKRVGNTDIEISDEYLESLIQFFLERNYKIISLDEVADLLSAQKRPERKFICFTFDDGYIDNYTIAYPLFKKYNLPLTIYITTSLPNKTAILWWYLLEDLLLENDRVLFDFLGVAHDYQAKIMEDKWQAFYSIGGLITEAHGEKRTELLNNLFTPYSIDLHRYSDNLTLDWRQIKLMGEDKLVTIGAHTVNHYALKKLNDTEMQQEIAASKLTIESYLGNKVEHFAYPFGNKQTVSSREIEAVKKLGFKTATTTLETNVFSSHAQYQQCLPRIGVWGYRKGLLKNDFLTSGFLPALRNRLRRIDTI